MIRDLFRLLPIIILMGGIIILVGGCTGNPSTLFKQIDPRHSGIRFNNRIIESNDFNIINVAYIYNGGGVASGDFNGDGLQDLFFSGNMVENRLYLNRGDMRFEDITDVAGVGALGQWKTGVALVDINLDGLLDIYICASLGGDPKSRANLLFVNKGFGKDGIPFFEEQAEAYGIADTSHSTNAVFFDYDKDSDLDLFVLTNAKQPGVPLTYKPKPNDGSSTNTDRLYRNNGDGTFTNVTVESGVLNDGYGLGVSILDVNKDGWQDIYVGNDYITNDLLYVNNQGYFREAIDQSINHQSRFSMGNDAGDINNDGYLDIITLDMLPENNQRRKTVMGGSGYITYINDEKYGYTHQHVRNMLQLNNGDMTFSEIGQLAGVHQTEWSWAPLFADFDNDGYKDLVVTNGFPKDVTDRDFISFREESGSYMSIDYLLNQIPSVKIPNYAFRNTGNLTFIDKSEDWGFTQPSFSNGAIYADLDNDGDLDFVVNNINDQAFLYENTTNKKANYLRVRLNGPKANPSGVGAKVTIFYGEGQMQYHEHFISRGYLSSVEDYIHFGLADFKEVDSVIVQWPDNREEKILTVGCNQVLEVSYATSMPVEVAEMSKKAVLVQQITARGLDYKHDEEDFIDFNIQGTLPHKFSQYGPGLAVGDLNGDNLEDFIVGGSKGYTATFFSQNPDGSFQKSGNQQDESKMYEDQGLLLFDADNDGDLDLYVVSGSYEYEQGSEFYVDRLFINGGAGNFSYDSSALPDIRSSGSCVRAADYDLDGDLDLFVGGRVVPGAYPKAPRSYLLTNENGKFIDATPEKLKYVGMVTDALWSDFDNDRRVDLIVVGEFMPVTFYKNIDNQLQAHDVGLDKYVGWWNSISAGDFDKDGDTDYVLGNLGENNAFCAAMNQPIEVIADDFDNNGSMDAVISCYIKSESGEMKPYPVHYWNELYAQSPIFRQQFNSYKEYAATTTYELLKPEQLDNAIHLAATHVASSYIENKGNSFVLKKLPIEAQLAPVNGMVTEDVDRDGNLDVILVGNDYGNETNVGQYDAFKGLILKGDGKGDFKPLKRDQSGFSVPGDAKALAKLVTKNGLNVLLATQNRDSLKSFSFKATSDSVLTPGSLDFLIEITYTDGTTEKMELYYGNGFLSQSSRRISVRRRDIKNVVFYDYSGNKRNVEVPVM